MSARKVAAFALGLPAVAIASCAGKPAAQAPPPLIARATTIERRTISTYASLDGTVDPYLSANLAPQQSGTLVNVYANEGDRVRKGQTLAKIDDSILRSGLTQQQGASTQSVAKLSQSQIQLPITNQSYASALVQAQRALELQKKQNVADAANVANTKLTYDADVALERKGYVAESTLQQARAAYIAAEQTFASDRDKLTQDAAAVAEAKQNLANTPLQEQVIAENRGAVQQAQGAVSQYQTSVAQTTIAAPFDGVVTARNLDPGSYASPSQAIFSLAQIDPIYVDFNVKDIDLPHVAPGTAVSFVTSVDPSRHYSGRVASVDAVPEPGTLLYRARIVEGNPDYSLRGGLEVTVRVALSTHANVATLPRAAVIQDGDKGTIYVLEPAGDHYVARQTVVHLGLQTGDYVEITGAGIKPGTLALLDQTDNISDGMAIATPDPSGTPTPTP
jgi:RND family efflux transporter MFP subunit